jgi:hypothetical protein
VVLVAVAMALAPVTVLAAGTFGYGWWRGWPAKRLYAVALWCLPMLAAWLIAVAAWPVRAATSVTSAIPGTAAISGGTRHVVVGGRSLPPGVGAGAVWFRVVAAPYRAWLSMWQLAGHGHLAAAAVAVAPPAIPLGIAAGGLAWAYRLFRMRTGAGGLTPAAPAAFDERQWRHQVRTARALLAAPGSLPLISASGHVVAGAAIRSVRHRPVRSAAIPYERLRSHQVVIGSTGTGKTTHELEYHFRAVSLQRTGTHKTL